MTAEQLSPSEVERARAALARWYWDPSPWSRTTFTAEEMPRLHRALIAPTLAQAEVEFDVTDDPLLVSPQQYAENHALLEEIRRTYGS
ncbi:hypothetical protein [Saccharopolyspora griseoalba]|uniref:Uncharacterized protein n=1 Tax=Saccharopolyspora griseoalba TaxID=1431848 RepID=A0ABW2LW78_9PSEU